MLLSSALMARYRQAFLFAVLLGVASFVQPQPHAQTQTDVTGEWEASYQTPLGPQELKIYVTQEGPRISGHTSSEYGESQVSGTINSQGIQFTFQSTDGACGSAPRPMCPHAGHLKTGLEMCRVERMCQACRRARRGAPSRASMDRSSRQRRRRCSTIPETRLDARRPRPPLIILDWSPLPSGWCPSPRSP
jgi:hypothetical protein